LPPHTHFSFVPDFCGAGIWVKVNGTGSRVAVIGEWNVVFQDEGKAAEGKNEWSRIRQPKGLEGEAEERVGGRGKGGGRDRWLRAFQHGFWVKQTLEPRV
jgi:hypothetical protein